MPKRKTRLGQHFLIDQQIIERIVSEINPQQQQTMVEIGPGKGALTIPLLKKLDTLHVVEIDRQLAQALSNKYMHEKNLIVHSVDAIKYDLNEIGTNKIRIVGNLPYNISTALILHLLNYHHLLDDMLFMLQEEIVDRICAAPGRRAYGYLSVIIRTHCYTEKLFAVAPDVFSPPPKVKSAVVKFKLHDDILQQIYDYPCFVKIIKKSFSQKRKTLKNCLQGLLDEGQLLALGISSKARAEELSVDHFIQLANMYCKQDKLLT